MMPTKEPRPGRLRERLTTGVPGLDAVMAGGLLPRAVYMLQGRPGAGKTILANQICFHHASQGGRVLYVTLLSETQDRMILNVEQLDFFEPSYIPERLSYLSAFTILEESGLTGLSEMLRRETRSAKATLLVVDGLVAIEELAFTSRHFKKFIHELQVHISMQGSTVLLLTSADPEPVGAELTMVDGVIQLRDSRVLKRAVRELEMVKFRGSNYLKGGHSFQISDAGISLYPRLEALLRDPPREVPTDERRLSTGIISLDRALSGGLRHASSTVLFGPTGVGKTTLGLHFLAEASEQEPGLLFGFYEPPERILIKSRLLGLRFDAQQKDGTLELLWYPTTERVLDALGAQLVAAVRRRNVKRLFVDGVEGFLQQAEDPERITHFMSALTHELRVLGVTTLYTTELHDLFSTEVGLPLRGLSSLVENALLLRFVQSRGQLLRSLTIIKTRDSSYDHTIRELRITGEGASLGEAIMSESSLR